MSLSDIAAMLVIYILLYFYFFLSVLPLLRKEIGVNKLAPQWGKKRKILSKASEQAGLRVDAGEIKSK